MNDAPSTVGLIIFMTALGLLPFIIVTMTAFLKISVVMFIVRNAIGLQQTPPTWECIRSPSFSPFSSACAGGRHLQSPLRAAARFQFARQAPGIGHVVKDPVKATSCATRNPASASSSFRPPPASGHRQHRANVKDDDFIILLPSFVSSELTRAFEIGFLLFLPFWSSTSSSRIFSWPWG